MNIALTLVPTLVLLSLVACRAQAPSPCSLSPKIQCGLMAIGLKDICECLHADAVCISKHLKGVTSKCVVKMLEPLCGNVRSFLDRCVKNQPCGAEAQTTKAQRLATKLRTPSTTAAYVRRTKTTGKTKPRTSKPKSTGTAKPRTSRPKTKESTTAKTELRSESGPSKEKPAGHYSIGRRTEEEDPSLISKAKDYMRKLDKQ